jgi:hypothetical protein
VREDPEVQRGEDGAARSAPASQPAPGKQTAVQLATGLDPQAPPGGSPAPGPAGSQALAT